MLEQALRKKGIPEVFVRSVVSLHKGAKQESVDCELSEEFEVKVGMHQGSVPSHFLFAVVVDVLTEFSREGALSELLYADDLFLMSDTIDGLSNKFIKWKETFESKGLKIILEKTKVMVSSGITKDDMSRSEWKLLLRGRITYRHCRQPKLLNFLYSSNHLFGGGAVDAGNAAPTFCFSVPAISELTTLTVEALWTVPSETAKHHILEIDEAS